MPEEKRTLFLKIVIRNALRKILTKGLKVKFIKEDLLPNLPLEPHR